MKGLIQCTKEYGCIAELWGDHAHLTEMTDNNSTAREAKRQVNVAQTHTNYQLSMSAEELIGVANLDKKVDWFHPSTHKKYNFSLRMVLLYYLKMQDGHSMIAEVHQEDLCKPTHIIIPQAAEAERIVGMMNNNLVAFLYHMLLEMDFTEEVVKLLIKKSCEVSLVHTVPMCKWDSKTRTLTTPEDKKHEREIKAFEGAAWFKDEFGFLIKGAKSQPCPPPKELFNLDSSSSIKTIHDCHQAPSILKKSSVPPAEGNKGEVDLTQEDDGDSASQTSSSSSSLDKDNNEANDRSCSKISTKDMEEEGAANGG